MVYRNDSKLKQIKEMIANDFDIPKSSIISIKDKDEIIFLAIFESETYIYQYKNNKLSSIKISTKLLKNISNFISVIF